MNACVLTRSSTIIVIPANIAGGTASTAKTATRVRVSATLWSLTRNVNNSARLRCSGDCSDIWARFDHEGVGEALQVERRANGCLQGNQRRQSTRPLESPEGACRRTHHAVPRASERTAAVGRIRAVQRPLALRATDGIIDGIRRDALPSLGAPPENDVGNRYLWR